MRLWSLDPSYLDAKGLVALWREGLLARAVLRGETRGYRAHPQLSRFLEQSAPVSAINAYLQGVLIESRRRGYRFDGAKLGPVRRLSDLVVTRGQLAFECAHLRGKLERRDPDALARLDASSAVRAHPLFRVVEGPIADWERGVL